MSSPLEDAIDAALQGELIVLPTDTVYGIGTRPDLPDATTALFAAKDRPRDLELPVLVSSAASAADLAILDERALRLAAALWPGALTIVARRTAESRPWDLGGDPETIGLRVPRHRLALAVLAGTGPLAVSSANRSGEPTPPGCEDLVATFGDAVAVYLCEDAPLPGTASTVVDLAHGEPSILREGTVDERAILEVLDGP